MSLDVTLRGENPFGHITGPQIYIREDGQSKRLSREEWDKRFPGREPVTIETREGELYSANITHNLTTMADQAGVYQALWRPEEINATKARDLIEPLTKGLELLRNDPDLFKRFNPPNGWGTYEGLVDFVEGYLLACTAFPSAEIEISR